METAGELARLFIEREPFRRRRGEEKKGAEKVELKEQKIALQFDVAWLLLVSGFSCARAEELSYRPLRPETESGVESRNKGAARTEKMFFPVRRREISGPRRRRK